MNYFSQQDAAKRYATGRPDFHANAINHIEQYLQLTQKLDAALDVACGTGLSTKALLAIAKTVYGTDISEQMIRLAPKSENIHYKIARAEEQPFSDNTFDLITVSSGVHWFAIDDFLSEAYRLLKSNSWLILYENHFIGEMENTPLFKNWYFEVYLKKFPSPPRNNSYDWSNQNLNNKNFNLQEEEKFTNPVHFNKQELGNYFTTQSNVIATVEKSLISYEEADQWLQNELSAFFENDEARKIIQFGNWIKYIQRID